MLATGALLLLLVTAPGGPALASGFTTPEPGMLEELRRRHRPGQVLRVTSGVARFECRAQDLDTRGLQGITAHGRSVPPIPLRWSSIERIDILTNRRTYGRVAGTILGGLGGLLLPAIPSGYRTDRPHQVRDYLFAGSLIGGWVGGYWGSRVIRERPLYVAPVAPEAPVAAHVAPPAPAVADSAGAPMVSDSVGTAAPIPPAGDANTTRAPGIPTTPNASPFDAVATGPEVQRALHRIDSGRLLRIDGPFGRFHGYASQANAAGLAGLRAEPTLQSVSNLRALEWREIERIDMRGGSAGQGALKGALVVGSATGLLGALLGMAIDSLGGGQGGVGPAFAGGGIGLGIGGAVGALVGTAVGAAVPSWHNVYVRP